MLLIDPFLKGNPTFEASGIPWETATEGVTHVALTHAHEDHVGDAAEVCIARNATLFAVFELAMHLGGEGVKSLEPMNTGGTVASKDFKLSFVKAFHSSSLNGVYLGNPCGIVVTANDGKSVYHMGDTEIFSDMALVDEVYKPAVGIVPIGDRFTMGAKTAALACRTYFNFKTVIPCHYGTFPIIDATADAFVEEMKGADVAVPKPGEAIDI